MVPIATPTGVFTFSSASLLLSPKPYFLPPSLLTSKPSPFPSFKILSSNSSQNYHLLTTTEGPDGCVVFRFGDDDELAQLQAELQEKVTVISTPTNSENELSDDVDDDDAVIHYKVLSPNGASGLDVNSSDVENQGEYRTEWPPSVPTEESTVLASVESGEERISAYNGSNGDDGSSNHECVVVGHVVPEVTLANAAVLVDEEPTISNAVVGGEEIGDDDDAMIRYQVLSPNDDSGTHEFHTELHPPVDTKEYTVLTSVESGEETISASGSIGDDGQSNKEGVVVGHTVPEVTLANAAILVDEEPTISNAVGDAPVGGEEIDNLKMLDGNVTSTICDEEIADMQPTGSTEMSIPHAVEPLMTGAAKIREEILHTSVLSSGAALLTHPSKALTGVKDAYFVDPNWFGIADGAGQWSLEGIDPGLFSQELIENCRKVASDDKSFSSHDPVEVLNKAILKTTSPGLSTILVASFDGQVLHAANVGDSGFIIVRNGSIFKRSSPMVHELNFPLQIESGDNPSDVVEVYRIDLNEGDVIVTATGGLFYNVYDQEIVRIISKSLQAGLNPKEIAEILGSRAQEVGKSTSARSPFADAAQAAGAWLHRNGAAGTGIFENDEVPVETILRMRGLEENIDDAVIALVRVKTITSNPVLELGAADADANANGLDGCFETCRWTGCASAIAGSGCVCRGQYCFRNALPLHN